MWIKNRFIKRGLFVTILTCSIGSCIEGEKTFVQETIDTRITTVDSNAIVYLNIRDIINYTSNCDTLKSSSLFPAPFDTLRFNKVIAYEFDGQIEHGETVFDKETGSFHETIENQVELNSDDVMRLTTILTRDSTYGGEVTACFEPKLGFVFYQDQSPNTVIDICLDCNFLKSTISFPETNYSIVTYENGAQQPQIGFSEQGVVEIVALCAKLNLKYGAFIQ